MQYTSPRNRPLPATPPSPVVRLPREPAPRNNQGLFEGSRLGKSIANKPDTFDGNKAKFRNWYRGIQWYLMGFDNMPSARQTILITLSYMKGDNAAGRYADLFAETRDVNMTVEEFEKDLIATFQPASLKRDAEKELLELRQKKGQSVEDYFTRLRQLLITAEYDEHTHASTLIHIVREGVFNEVVEFVERGQPRLLEIDNLGQWEKALIRADNMLKDIASRKSGSSNKFFTPRSGYTPAPKAQATAATTSTGSSLTSVHPNAPGTFGGAGVPMDLAKARAEGKCRKCGKPWLCKEHFKPCVNTVRTLKFRGVTFTYKDEKELEEKLEKIESDFVEGSQL